MKLTRIDATIWDNHLKPFLWQHKKKTLFTSMKLIKPQHDNTNTAAFFIKGKEINKLHQLLQTPKRQGMTPPHSSTLPLTDNEKAMCKLHDVPQQ